MGDNYYRKFPGDYQRDTRHLSLAGHGAYNLLLDYYYATEKPLPADINTLVRIVGAQGKSEREAVEEVAASFFTVAEDGLRHNARADRELSERMEYSNAQAMRAHMRWHSKSNAGGYAGVMPPSPSPSPSPSLSPSPSPVVLPAAATADGFAYQGERLVVSRMDHARLSRLYPVAFLIEQYPAADLKFSTTVPAGEEVNARRCSSWIVSWCQREWDRVRKAGDEERYQSGRPGKRDTTPHDVTYNPKGQAFRNGKRAPEHDVQ